MLEYALVLSTDCCQKILRHLYLQRSWSTQRIARIVGMPAEYVRRIESGKQSLQVSDFEALAKACRCVPMELVFNAMGRDEFPQETRELYDMAAAETERHHKFERTSFKKSVKNRKQKERPAA